MPESKTLIEFLQEKGKVAHKAVWIEPTINILSADTRFMEEILGEARQGIFSQQSCAGEKLHTELLLATHGRLEGRGRSAKMFVKEHLAEYLQESVRTYYPVRFAAL